ncbi:MAG: hypothetical protein J5556_07505 [Deltaproteobacteria bacterium]|jgi:uncharacterized membrane protein|nr:hypothetical protein [Deltaproteobacteria bacterium]
MWMLLGLAAIAAAVVNIVMGSMGRETKYYRFASLALTAMTVCAFYSDGARRVLAEDWNGLTDIMPTMSKALWVCVIVSILVNGISLVKKKA